jgi:hypothetical protein
MIIVATPNSWLAIQQDATDHRSMPFKRSSKAFLPAVVAALAVGTVVARRRGYSGLGGNTIVRCHKGHLFKTIWIPGASIKSIRLGPWRFQYCPVGRHFSLVAPVKDTELTRDERRAASASRDVRIP